MAGPIFLLFLFFLPETQPTTILLHRAARLRARTGNPDLRTQTEIDRKGTSFAATLLDAIIKPVEIAIKDPAVGFVNLYTALTYGIYYSFFEVFPLVYPPMYGFNAGQTALIFICIIVGCVIGISIYYSYLNWYLIPDILKNGMRQQEHRLVPAIFASFGPPIGLFIFGKLTSICIEEISTHVARLDGASLYSLDCLRCRTDHLRRQRFHHSAMYFW